MAGERELDEVIVAQRGDGDLLPAGQAADGQPDRSAGQPEDAQLLGQLRERFDFVVIDSAPLLGVTDTKVVSRFADKVLFVMQWDKTSRDTATNALAHLREAHGPGRGRGADPGRRASSTRSTATATSASTTASTRNTT